MTNQEAIEILEKHIDTYKYQLTDGGYAHMVKMGIAKPSLKEKIGYRADALKQIEAYEKAIEALKISPEN